MDGHGFVGALLGVSGGLSGNTQKADGVGFCNGFIPVHLFFPRYAVCSDDLRTEKIVYIKGLESSMELVVFASEKLHQTDCYIAVSLLLYIPPHRLFSEYNLAWQNCTTDTLKGCIVFAGR
jgi:hypothetical protein